MILPPPSSKPAPIRLNRELLTAWLLLLIDAGSSHGYDMRRELAARHLDADPASVYRTLSKLEREGQLRSRWGSTVDGPRRRLYEITPAGRSKLAESAGRIVDIRQSHDEFLKAYSRANEQPEDHGGNGNGNGNGSTPASSPA